MPRERKVVRKLGEKSVGENGGPEKSGSVEELG